MIKHVVFLCMVIVSVVSGQDGGNITLTPVKNYALSGMGGPTGMDLSNMYYELYIADPVDDTIYFVSPDNGSVNASLPCPGGLSSVTGVVSSEFWGTHAMANNREPDHDIWVFDTDWNNAFTNPVPHVPGEMDIDPSGNFWCQDASDRKLYLFDFNAENVTSWSMPDCPASQSIGLEVFSMGSDLGIVLGGYSWNEFFFYRYDGTDLSFLGSAAVPHSCASSLGIAYSSYMDSFFWLYRDDTSVYNICEFTVSLGSSSFQTSTWGSIKAML